MQPDQKKSIVPVILIAAAIIVVGAVIFFSTRKKPAPPAAVPVAVQETGPKQATIGHSVDGRAIDAYAYGTGLTHLLFVGGIHGGYEWNSVLLAYTFMDYLKANPDAIPANLTVTVIPSANPDAVYDVVGKEGRFTVADVSTSTKVLTAARFNADNVDLNRNFDCKWQPKSTWQSKTVSAGKSTFSEPEAQAIRDFIAADHTSAAVFWHSAAGAVYASQCKNGILPETLKIVNAYAGAAGYPAVKTFDAYATTGAADDWLASQNIPAFTVEFKTHDSIEWDRNLAGIKAMLAYYAAK